MLLAIVLQNGLSLRTSLALVIGLLRASAYPDSHRPARDTASNLLEAPPAPGQAVGTD